MLSPETVRDVLHCCMGEVFLASAALFYSFITSFRFFHDIQTSLTAHKRPCHPPTPDSTHRSPSQTTMSSASRLDDGSITTATFIINPPWETSSSNNNINPTRQHHPLLIIELQPTSSGSSARVSTGWHYSIVFSLTPYSEKTSFCGNLPSCRRFSHPSSTARHCRGQIGLIPPGTHA